MNDTFLPCCRAMAWFERYRIRKRIANLTITDSLPSVLYDYQGDGAPYANVIRASDCTSLDAETLVWLIWEAIRDSQSWFGPRTMIIEWQISGPRDFHGWTFQVPPPSRQFRIRFRDMGADDRLVADCLVLGPKYVRSPGLDCQASPAIIAVRVSQRDYRACIYLGPFMEDLMTKPWKEWKERGYIV
jgi:hypothetical protein